MFLLIPPPTSLPMESVGILKGSLGGGTDGGLKALRACWVTVGPREGPRAGGFQRLRGCGGQCDETLAVPIASQLWPVLGMPTLS